MRIRLQHQNPTRSQRLGLRPPDPREFSGLTALAGIDKIKKHFENDEKEAKKLSDAIEDREGKAKDWKQVQQGATDFAESVNSFAGMLDVLEETPPPDGVKLVMSKADFDSMIAPYREMNEAKNYISLMDEFFDLNDQRNKIILTLEVNRQRIAAISAQLDLHIEREQQFLRFEAGDLLAQAQSIYEHARWMEMAARTRVLEVIAEANRALEYWNLQSSAVPIGEASQAALEIAYQDFLRANARWLNALGEAGQRFPEDIPDFRITIERADEPTTFIKLETEHRCTVRLRGDTNDLSFLGRWNIRVSGVRLEFFGSPDMESAEIPVQIVHLGDSRITDKAGVEHVFAHKPRITQVTVAPNVPVESVAGILNLGDSADEFIMVSPLASYEIIIGPGHFVPEGKLMTISFIFAGVCHLRTWVTDIVDQPFTKKGSDEKGRFGDSIPRSMLASLFSRRSVKIPPVVDGTTERVTHLRESEALAEQP